ncbi:MAG: type 4a pilus biogenesis protein PilO [Sulfuriferula sp.]
MMKTFQNLLQRFSAARASAPSLWYFVRWTAQRWLRRIGWPGMLAIGILAMCPAFYFSAISSEQARLTAARHSAVSLHKQLVLAGKSVKVAVLSPEDRLAAFYQEFPTEGCSPQLLEKLVVLASNHGLSLNDGEYKTTQDKVGKLVRYQMTLPVQGEYPQIRKFLAALPTELPAIALENVQFERPKIADPRVEAKIRLVLYLRQVS